MKRIAPSSRWPGILRLAIAYAFAVLLDSPVYSQQPQAGLTFEHDVRPTLKAYCLDCHGGNEKLEGGLDLRLAKFAVRGGETGPAVVVGAPDQSLLLSRYVAGAQAIAFCHIPSGLYGKFSANFHLNRLLRLVFLFPKSCLKEPLTAIG